MSARKSKEKGNPSDGLAAWSEYGQAIAGLHLPRFEEIPEIDLYMDQLIGYVGQQVAPFALPQDKPLTGSMVNNYVKMHIVPQPVSKRYRREHVAMLVAVCILKRTYSMADIEQLLSKGVVDRGHIQPAYDCFIDLFERDMHLLFCEESFAAPIGGMSVEACSGAFSLETPEGETLTQSQRFYLMVAQSCASAIYVEQAIDSGFFDALVI